MVYTIKVKVEDGATQKKYKLKPMKEWSFESFQEKV